MLPTLTSASSESILNLGEAERRILASVLHCPVSRGQPLKGFQFACTCRAVLEKCTLKTAHLAGYLLRYSPFGTVSHDVSFLVTNTVCNLRTSTQSVPYFMALVAPNRKRSLSSYRSSCCWLCRALIAPLLFRRVSTLF